MPASPGDTCCGSSLRGARAAGSVVDAAGAVDCGGLAEVAAEDGGDVAGAAGGGGEGAAGACVLAAGGAGGTGDAAHSGLLSHAGARIMRTSSNNRGWRTLGRPCGLLLDFIVKRPLVAHAISK